MSHFEVLTFTLCDGFVNCWADEHGKPQTFPSRIHAHLALNEFIADSRQAAAEGNLEEAYASHHFKIVEVSE